MEIQKDLPTRVEQEGTHVVADGHIRLERRRFRTETFSGGMSKTVSRDIARVGRSVGVLLYDPAAHAFVLTEQFRLGAYLNQEQPWLLECAAGMVDEGETTEETARREVEEETGLKAGRLELIGRYLTTPGLIDELITMYVAQVDASKAGGVHGKSSEGEDIRVCVVPVAEALAASQRGEILNIVGQVAMLWFALHGAELRNRWLGTPDGEVKPANTIHVIRPYRYSGMWVFDDPRVGLSQEPFVGGADAILDKLTARIPNAEKGFTMLFSDCEFPGYQLRFDWVCPQASGNAYRSSALQMEGWLCPALLKYFESPPRELFVQLRPA